MRVCVGVNAKILHIEASRVFVRVEIRFLILDYGIGADDQIVFKYFFLFFILERD